MREDQIKKIITKSKLETSSQFTDELMDKIQLQQETNIETPWSFKRVLLGLIAVVVVTSLMLLALNGSLFAETNGFRFEFISYLVFLSLSCIGINQLLKLRKTEVLLQQ